MKGFPDLMCTLTVHRVDFVCLFGSVGICLHYTIIFPPQDSCLKGNKNHPLPSGCAREGKTFRGAGLRVWPPE